MSILIRHEPHPAWLSINGGSHALTPYGVMRESISRDKARLGVLLRSVDQIRDEDSISYNIAALLRYRSEIGSGMRELRAFARARKLAASENYEKGRKEANDLILRALLRRRLPEVVEV